MFKFKNLPQEEQKIILLDCDKVKNGTLTEDNFYDKYFDKYGNDFDIPEHYLTNYKYTAQEIKNMTLNDYNGTKTNSKYENIKKEHQEKPKDSNGNIDFNDLLSDVLDN